MKTDEMERLLPFQEAFDLAIYNVGQLHPKSSIASVAIPLQLASNENTTKGSSTRLQALLPTDEVVSSGCRAVDLSLFSFIYPFL